MVKVRTKKVSAMSSEEEATAANVLSQMSQIQQISCETIEATVINVGHHCDVETTATQGAWNFFVVLCVRLYRHTHSQRCQPKKKTSKSRRSPILPFLNLKKLFKVEISQLNFKKCINNAKPFPPKCHKSAKIWLKNVFYALLFILSGRFGDPYGRALDSFCIQETPRSPGELA